MTLSEFPGPALTNQYMTAIRWSCSQVKKVFIEALAEMVGQRIEKVGYAERDGTEYVYLFFADGTHMELYTDGEMRSSKGTCYGTHEQIESNFKRDDLRYVIK